MVVAPFSFENDGDGVGIVLDDGDIDDDDADRDSVASRPAFNLNLSSVLFTSAAVGGKSSSAGGGADFFEISAIDNDGEPYEWKLTLKDSENHKNFALGNVTRSGDTLTVAYSGAETGANEKISYIITDKDQKEIKYYGNQAATSASGSVNITLPTMADTDKLFVFNEQANGDYRTDYASELKEVTIPAAGFAVTANANDSNMGSVTSSKPLAQKGESVTLTATANAGYKFTGFTSDVEIYTNGNKGMFTMPENDVTVTANFAAVTGANAITVKSNFAGMGTVSSDKATATFGEEVTLTAEAKPGNTFVEFASPDVEIGEDGKFIMPDKAVYVQAIFKADASFTPTEGHAIQAQKDNDTAVLRFMWTLDKTAGAYLANIGAYILPWDRFNKDTEELGAKPAIVLVSEPNMASGKTFSADYINIPEAEFGTDFLAIPFINGTFFTNALLYGNVNTYDVDKAQTE